MPLKRKILTAEDVPSSSTADACAVTRNLPESADNCLPLVIDGVQAEENFRRTKTTVYALLLCNSDVVALTFYMRDGIPSWSVPHLTFPELKQRWPGTRTYEELL